MRLTFAVDSSRLLIFTDESVKQMSAYAQRSFWHREAGGILLGRYLVESSNVVVDEVTIPQRADKRSRFGFFRSHQHSTLAQTRWAASHGTAAYLGLWHTHPETDPTPSCVDRNDWSKAVATDSFDGEELFFPIVGTERIRVWTKSRCGPIRELAEVNS
jgi:integrative and conjugative element protein (TIGR02256 family)